jgi:hypothetical protein
MPNSQFAIRVQNQRRFDRDGDLDRAKREKTIPKIPENFRFRCEKVFPISLKGAGLFLIKLG